MTRDESFLHAILDDPWDDAVRLIYADWLDDSAESGPACDPARAEFIRVQCKIAGDRRDCTYGCPDSPGCERCKLRRRERNLLNGRNARAWFDGPWFSYEWCDASTGLAPQVAITHRSAGARYDPGPRLMYTFRRGFVEAVTVTPGQWREHGRTLLGAHPLTEVRLSVRVGTGKWQVNVGRMPGTSPRIFVLHVAAGIEELRRWVPFDAEPGAAVPLVVECGAAIAAGDRVTADAQRRAVPAGPGDRGIGLALRSSAPGGLTHVQLNADLFEPPPEGALRNDARGRAILLAARARGLRLPTSDLPGANDGAAVPPG